MHRTPAVAVLLLLTPGWALAQAVTIDHRAVGCVVAGQYPILNACFSPQAELARARVYFRATGTPHWYYVEMASAAPCFTGTLPKPKKDIEKLDYYVEATDRKFTAARTTEASPMVVDSEGECDKRLLLAPFTRNANVVVGAAAGAPAVPVGFASTAAAGISTTALVVGGGVAAAGTTAALAAGGGGSVTPPTTGVVATTAPPPPTTAPTTTVPATTVPPGTTPGANRPPVPDFNANPLRGDSPLQVNFNMCQSRDPDEDPLRFTFDFGDETGEQGFCRAEHTYRGFTGDSWTATLCVSDRQPGHEFCQEFRVQITGPPPPTSTPNPCADDHTPPTVDITDPPDGTHVNSFSTALNVTADASDASGIANVKFLVDGNLHTQDDVAPYEFDWVGPSNECGVHHEIKALATDRCGIPNEDKITVVVDTDCGGCTVGETRGGCVDGAPAGLSWTSELEVKGATAQVVLNGSSAFFPAGGRTEGRFVARRGENRLEAQLVTADGEPGLWRLTLSGESSFVAGSLRVDAGEVVAADARSVTVRLQGRPGERVVLSFEAH